MADLAKNERDWPMLEAVAGAACLVSRAGRVVHANAAAGRLFGRDVAGSDLKNGSFEDDLPIFVHVVESYRIRGGEASATGELIIATTPSGSSFYWATMSPVDGAEGFSGGCLLIVQEITAALTEAPALNKILSQVRHDLKSPLTSIGGAAELLLSGRMGELPGVQRRLVAIIEEGTQKMGSILARTTNAAESTLAAAAGDSTGD
ncbi:MAG TPA: histidine kinase dimerization/phospho-acceptor domain-containing protein [Candidatus Polarisedimenticolia bacterium]|nr:histidine kinase dimerization/phospho-acceptor domain-containing protein [Candidatus Polarisedimenticolia bacterium]